MAETAGPTLVELRVLDGAGLYFPRPGVRFTLDMPDQLRARVVAARAG
jgi:hypothetical protein